MGGVTIFDWVKLRDPLCSVINPDFLSKIVISRGVRVEPHYFTPFGYAPDSTEDATEED